MVLQATFYVARVLNGAKPGDLPIEQPIKFDLAVNSRPRRPLA
jgi:putative ABC transport system substrate-binding protein